MSEERVVPLGKITAAHGIQGEVKVTLFVDDAEFLREHRAMWIEGRPRRRVTLTRIRLTANQAILAIEGVEDRTAAEQLRGRELTVPLSWLPPLEEDEYYVAEIVGLEVVTDTGERLGTVAEVIFTGANEVYIVRGGPRGEILLPAIASVVLNVDLEARRLTVSVPEGLLD